MHVLIDGLARLFALLGGLVLSALIVMTCGSIAGRSLNTVLHGDWVQSALGGPANWLLDLGVGPINGDFELVEAGMAFTIFAFLPLCQLNGAHAAVDIFTSRFPLRFNRMLRAIVEAVFAIILVIIAWQLFRGMQSKLNSGQTTLLLQFPLWWAYALALCGAVASAVTGVYVAAAHWVEAATGRSVLPPETEAAH